MIGLGDFYKELLMYRYLAKTTTRSHFVVITYIVFLTKLQKRQTPHKEFALFEKRYHRFWSHC